ncbi:DnaB-like helicase C-terminal domain-containing protein [Romboutsia sp.]|uniref:DnaB-like helicase C-terminal domain-containing protein n=1 Tax=Romboutsia sp. TaxID=1965302 RepID=UPI002BA8AD1C|nr:DnaB-like helicase C-terminal domain-containing protein [Romboutsia sp.]HSQ90187.1 DnaB-like helicase C-terminal domain-containing protein [Romboutsia sp.]
MEIHEIKAPSVERSILAICMQNTDEILNVETNEVFAEHFTIDGNRYIYNTMLYLYNKGAKPTSTTIMEVITNEDAKKAINDLGGLSYIDDIGYMDIDRSNLRILCEKLKQTYTRRKIYDLCESTKDKMLSDESKTLNPSELVASLEGRVTDLSMRASGNSSGVSKMGDGLEERLQARMDNPSEIPGLESGLTTFDYYTNGGQPGDLIVFCARAKCGKSVILSTIAKKLAIEDGLPVLYFDTEMSKEEQEDRLLSMVSGVPHKEIMSGMFACDTASGKAVDKLKKIKEATKKIEDAPYYHIYMPNFNAEKVTALTKQYRHKYNIQAMFFDYIKVPATASGSLQAVKEYQALGFFTSTLKDIAGILQIPVYTACQENRSDSTGTEKSANNVGGSDRILQLATKLIFLYVKSDEQIAKQGISAGNRQLLIAFQRNGQSGVAPINLQFDNSIMSMREC